MTRSIRETRIVILNYNGRALLEECLPSIVEAAQFSKRKTAVTVLDNQSTDDSINFLKIHFPSVEILEAPANRILFSYNDAFKKICEEAVILLNNDIRVDRGFVDPLIDSFEKDVDIFAVGSKCLDFDGRGFQGEKSIAGIRFGLFWTDSRYEGYQKDMERSSWTAQVALGAFDREKFLELGGYDDLYFPGMWEDTDISFQAYRRGWHCFYEPKSVIYHKGQVTFHKEYGSNESAIIAYRNTFLFMWKNFGKTRIFFCHLFFLPFRLALAAFKGNKAFLAGFLRALKLRRQAVLNKKNIFFKRKRSDTQILSILKRRFQGAS